MGSGSFPGFYRHLDDTMDEIPYRGRTVKDNLVTRLKSLVGCTIWRNHWRWRRSEPSMICCGSWAGVARKSPIGVTEVGELAASDLSAGDTTPGGDDGR
jgi:hypothetical protein